MKKTSNASYFITLGIILIIFVFFFSTPYWISSGRKKKNENYNVTNTLSSYSFKINAAQYDPENQKLRLNYYVKENRPDTSYFPEIKEVTLGDSTGKRLPYEVEPMPENINQYGYYITINDVPSDFAFIRVYITVKDFDVQPPDTIDEFGNVIHPDIKKGAENLTHISVDKLDCAIGITDNETPIFETVTEVTEDTDMFTVSESTEAVTEEIAGTENSTLNTEDTGETKKE